MKAIHLNFEGYWGIEHLHLLPRATGVACLYRARVSEQGEHVTPLELLWIGDVLSAREAFSEMNLKQMEQSTLERTTGGPGMDPSAGGFHQEVLCVSFAPIVRGRREAAESLAEQSQPKFRKRKLWNPFPSPQVTLSGTIALLQVPPFRRELWQARESPASA